MTRRSIVQKYREGKLKITLKRKLKETEIAGGEAVKEPVLVEIFSISESEQCCAVLYLK